MNLIPHQEPFPYLEIEDFYTEKELKLVWKELDFLGANSASKLSTPENSGGAINLETGEMLKSNKSIFLEAYYGHRDYSEILKLSPKFYEKKIQEALVELHPFYRAHLSINRDLILVSYYENGDYYKRHVDRYVFSTTLWLHKEPKAFVGGDFIMSDYGYIFEPRNNCGVILPSSVAHEVTPIVMAPEEETMGRFSITNFATIVDFNLQETYQDLPGVLGGGFNEKI